MTGELKPPTSVARYSYRDGSVKGELRTLSDFSGTTFIIWDSTGYSARLEVPDELIDTAFRLFGKHVEVTGNITSSDMHGLIRIRVTDIQPCLVDKPVYVEAHHIHR